MSKTCKQCRYFDYSHEICRHPCGSKSYEDVGEEDACEQFVNKQKRMNSEEVLDGLESIRNDYGCQAEIYEQRIIDDTIKLIKDHERTITNQQHVIKCLEYDMSNISKEQCPYYHDNDCLHSLLADALTLPKKEAPKKVRAKGNVGVSDIQYGECPWCGGDVLSNAHPHHCGHCGKALQWNDAPEAL